MATPDTPASDTPRDAARSLIEQRSTLEGWLARLDQQTGGVPAHIVDRVREDYSSRLKKVTDELGSHLGALREDLDAQEADLRTAETRHRERVDELEELRLRHLIGEVETSAWEEQRVPLEESVSAADAERSSLQEKVDRIRTMVQEVEAATTDQPITPSVEEPELPAPAAAEPVSAAPAPWSVDEQTDWEPDIATTEVEQVDEVEEEPVVQEAAAENETGDLPWLDSLAPDAETVPVEEEGGFDDLDFLRTLEQEPAQAGSQEAAGGGDDLAFLEELDRAIAASSQPAPLAGIHEHVAAKPDDTGEKKIIACGDCGSSNDARAWYCEVCGSELS